MSSKVNIESELFLIVLEEVLVFSCYDFSHFCNTFFPVSVLSRVACVLDTVVRTMVVNHPEAVPVARLFAIPAAPVDPATTVDPAAPDTSATLVDPASTVDPATTVDPAAPDTPATLVDPATPVEPAATPELPEAEAMDTSA